MAAPPHELAPGLWRWTARHPEWHPGRFGAEVASYALLAGDELLLIDPLLPDHDDDHAGEGPVLAALDPLADGRAVAILVTIGYHVRSAEPLRARYGGRIVGPRRCAARLDEPERLETPAAGSPGPGGALAYTIGKPVRGERPLWLPSHRALAFGDALVTTPEGELRVWAQERVDQQRRRWYRDRFAPTFAPLLELPVEHVLVTHGAPVLGGGRTALRAALAADPWTPSRD